MKTPRAKGPPRDGLNATGGGREARSKLQVPIDGSGHLPALVGGKAAALDRLVAAGFRVPPSVALTCDAYRAFVRSADLTGWLARFARRRVQGTAASDAERAEVEAAFLDAPLPSTLRDAIAEAWASVSGEGPVAVRSSATAEDLVASSFAGQHLTVLEVNGIDEVEVSVKRVWASLWEAGARAYRRRMRVDNRGLAMAVVIQKMVPALRSGVCFTIDPTRDAALRVEFVDGLGEQLVSGAATPTVLQLSKPGLKTLDGSPVDDELRSVARVALRIQEEMRGRPQDVEWSIAEDGLWVLQARPITTLNGWRPPLEGDGFDTERIPGALYSPTGVGEMLPGVLPPLLWTINAPMVEDGFRRLFARMDAFPHNLDRAYSVLARIQGQAALNITAIAESAATLSGVASAEIERQYLGRAVSSDDADPPTGPGLLARTSASLRAMKLQKIVESEARSFERSVETLRSVEIPLDDMLGPELVAYRARVRDLAAGGIATQVAVATTAVTSYASLEATLDRWTGAGAEWAQRLTRGAAISHDPVTTATKLVWDRFKDSSDAARIVDAIADGEPGTIEDRLDATGDAGATFAAELRHELEKLGSSAVYAGPLWTEQRAYVWSVLMRWFADLTSTDGVETVREQARDDLSELEKALTTTWKWRAKRVLTGQVIDIRKRLLHQMIDDARRLLQLRESLKRSILALGGIERRAVMELGRRLVRRGQIPSLRDVHLLTDWELDEAALGRASIAPEVLDARRRAVAAYASGPTLGALVQETAEVTATSDRVEGWAASPGKHRGRVRIVRDLAHTEELGSGDVLVASATDPSWTPLFLIAGAIVVERGGPLSHAAIVSRELGVPAVLNASGATSVLRDGALVEVDGSTGTVIVLEEPPLEETG